MLISSSSPPHYSPATGRAFPRIASIVLAPGALPHAEASSRTFSCGVLWALLPLLFGLVGCSSSRPPSPGEARAPVPMSQSGAVSSLAPDGGYSTDQERLALLWTERTREPSIRDYPLGPGDELEISVPGMEEFTPSRVVRVSSKGTITLPFVGVLQAGGQTEEELKTEIRNRLQNGYMYNPQVDLFVREYHSRQVAVIGAVKDPGLYSLASESDTLLDMISHAGGMTQEAATRIFGKSIRLGINHLSIHYVMKPSQRPGKCWRAE